MPFLQGMTSDVFSWLLWIAVFTLFMFFFNEIQLQRYLMQIGNFISFVNVTLNSSIGLVRKALLSKRRAGVTNEEVDSTINRILDFTVIDPVSIEPSGLVSRWKSILTTYTETLEREVTRILGGNDRVAVLNLATSLEALRYLNLMYKVLDHYYRLARKYKNIYLVVPLFFMLPQLREQVEIINDAISAFLKGTPIGDSAGPYVVYNISKTCGARLVHRPAQDTVLLECEYEGRRLYIVRAEGPGSTVGRLDDAVEYVLSKMGARLKYIITIDAAAKLEGEKVGAIAEGVGVAMGGIGVERFNIETLAAKYGVPLYAFLIKMGVREALTTMTKEVKSACEDVAKRVLDFVRTNVNPGDSVLIVGVGNTVGVGGIGESAGATSRLQ